MALVNIGKNLLKINFRGQFFTMFFSLWALIVFLISFPGLLIKSAAQDAHY